MMREIKNLKEDGIIKTEGKKITINYNYYDEYEYLDNINSKHLQIIKVALFYIFLLYIL